MSVVLVAIEKSHVVVDILHNAIRYRFKRRLYSGRPLACTFHASMLIQIVVISIGKKAELFDLLVDVDHAVEN
jgi:hypothetical protein